MEIRDIFHEQIHDITVKIFITDYLNGIIFMFRFIGNINLQLRDIIIISYFFREIILQ